MDDACGHTYRQQAVYCRCYEGNICGKFYKQTNQNLFRQLIQEGQKSGEFKKNIDVVLMMTTMVGTVSQMITSQNFYKQCHNLGNLNEPEFQKLIRKRLSAHLKNLFKVMLTYEA